MIYVRDLSADSTWLTELAFLVTNSSYNSNHLDGRSRAAEAALSVLHVASISTKGRRIVRMVSLNVQSGERKQSVFRCSQAQLESYAHRKIRFIRGGQWAIPGR